MPLGGKDSCEATGSRVGVRVGFRIHRQRLPAADQARVRLGVRVRLRRVRVGTSDAIARRPVHRAGGGLAPAAAADTPIQLAAVGAVLAGATGPAARRAQGQRAADRRAGCRPGSRPSHRVGRPMEAARARRCDREETWRGANAADLPRLRARRRHQLRGVRLAGTISTSGDGPTSTAAVGLRCCCRFPAAPG